MLESRTEGKVHIWFSGLTETTSPNCAFILWLGHLGNCQSCRLSGSVNSWLTTVTSLWLQVQEVCVFADLAALWSPKSALASSDTPFLFCLQRAKAWFHQWLITISIGKVWNRICASVPLLIVSARAARCFFFHVFAVKTRFLHVLYVEKIYWILM